MLWRIFSLALCQLVAAAIAWFFAPVGQRHVAATWMALVGGYIWFVADAARGLRLLHWLRNGALSDLPLSGGLWGETYDRIRRLLRTHQRATAQGENRLQDFLAALQASPSGVVLLDDEARIEWFNQMAAEHFGFDPQRDMLQHFGNLVRDPAFAAYFLAGDFSNDITMPGRNHSVAKPVNLSVHIHPYGGGRSLLLSRDITALEQAEAMRRDFVANVSHEIRTPLTVLAGFVETLQTLDLPEQERQRFLELMSQQSQRMQTLVSDLLMLSRLEGSPLPSVQGWVSLDALMAQCQQEAGDLSRLLTVDSHELHFSWEPGYELAGSATELHSAMSNLIGNAIRYTPAQQRIDVECAALPAGGLVFTVKDAGPGIAPEHIPRLTERFYRVDRSRSRDTGGTGLGLAIVKHVAQRHAAKLGIVSTLGKGSTFSIQFAPQRVRRTGNAA